MLPLEGALDSDPSRGGYEYLDWSDYQRGWHEGIDLNCGSGIDGDLGAPLLALCTMRLAFNGSTSRGFGNHQWWQILSAGPYQGSFVHYAHADSFETDEVGVIRYRGDKIGTCGKSGGQYAAHLHLAVKKTAPEYWQWYGAPGLSKEDVDAATHDPQAWWKWCNDNENEIEKSSGERRQTMTPDEIAGLNDDERGVLAAIKDSGYPITEVSNLLWAAKEWSANAGSLGQWIEKIGALEAALAERDAQLASAQAEIEALKSGGTAT